MDFLPEILYEIFSPGIIFGVVALLVICVNEICDTNLGTKPLSPLRLRYSYDGPDGPSSWKNSYSLADGNRQSPINIIPFNTITIPLETASPLEFSTEYSLLPRNMRLHNTGHCLHLYSSWNNGQVPSVIGGPLEEPYSFDHMTFRWGHNNEEGTEHMINYKKYAMELQAFYVKSNSKITDFLPAADCGAVLVISYLFMATSVDSPYLEPIITALKGLKIPLSQAQIEPIPLGIIAPTFQRNYYSYIGSLSYPPCTEGVRWIVQPEPLAISERQVRKFNKLFGCNGFIYSNVRPVQNLNDRDVFYYD